MMLPRNDGCIKCGACVRSCPVMRSEGPSVFPGPRRLAVEAPRLNRELEALRDPFLLCTTCAKCEDACPSRLPLTDSVIKMRNSLFSTEMLAEGHRRLIGNIDRFGRAVEPSSVYFGGEEKGEVLYFPGCIGQGRMPSSCFSSLDLLRQGKRSVYVPLGWVCCGSPLEKVGDKERTERVRTMNTVLFEDAAQIVTSCPGCTTQVRRNYDLEPLHTLEYLFEVIGPKRLHFKEKGRIKVALHQPCHLIRAVGPHTIDYALELLMGAPAVEVVELPEADACCGGGGGVASACPEVALRMARRKAENAVQVGADLLLAPCPFCVINLGRAQTIEVQEFTEFLRGRLE